MFRLASSPSAAGDSTSPADSAGAPCSKSSPSKRRLSPGCSRPGGMSISWFGGGFALVVVSTALVAVVFCAATLSWVTSVHSSCGTTVSSPSGMMAPVMILMHSPGPTLPCHALPASAVPTTWKRLTPSVFKSAPAKAKPSMAELSCGGTLIGETTSCASTRPSAACSGTVSACCTGATNSAKNSFTLSAGSAAGS